MNRWWAAWRGLPAGQKAMIAAVTVLLGLLQIDQPYPETAPLHHVPTLAALLAAPLILARWPLTTGELAAVMLFLALHCIGGRWTYSNVPYQDWIQLLPGLGADGRTGWERNHYDRFVHLMFGLLAVPPVVGLARRAGGLSFRAGAALAVGVVLAVGAVYEMFEWVLSLTAPPELADEYNGQQGDPWDAQKDMALAFAGALAAAGWLAARRRVR